MSASIMTERQHLIAARLLSQLRAARQTGVEVIEAKIAVGSSVYEVWWDEREGQYWTRPAHLTTADQADGEVSDE